MKTLLTLVLCASACLAGCAMEARRHSTQITATGTAAGHYVAGQTISITLDSSYSRTIHEGTELELVDNAAGESELKDSSYIGKPLTR